MADFIPPIVVDIVASSAGFETEMAAAKADMAASTAAFDASAGDIGASMDRTKGDIHGAVHDVHSDFDTFAADVAGNASVFDQFAAGVHNKSAVAGDAFEGVGKDAEEGAKKTGGAWQGAANAIGSALGMVGVPIDEFK